MYAQLHHPRRRRRCRRRRPRLTRRDDSMELAHDRTLVLVPISSFLYEIVLFSSLLYVYVFPAL